MNIENISESIIATVLGGAILTLLFFWAREKLFPFTNIIGRWHFEMLTINTAYNPYKGMVLRYTAILWREGNLIRGTVEKVFENSSTGERNYVGKARTRGRVEGYIEKKIFSKDHLFLHIEEDGHERVSTTFHHIKTNSPLKMTGTFESMVADQDGKVTWQREQS